MDRTDDIIIAGIGSELHNRKNEHQSFYDQVSRQLGKTAFGDLSFFLNLGYAANGSPKRAIVELPRSFVNRNSAQLVLELIGHYPIDRKRVLDVGCGRGGAISVLKRFFDPASLTGLDLSGEAIAFARRVHQGARFVHGDAEQLPFEKEDFDVVLNIESSHSYPSIDKFYSEVHRVLVPGGVFLYTDLFSKVRLPTLLGSLEALGFSLAYSCDITPNVVVSCNEIAAGRAAVFSQGNNVDVLADFLAVPGSSVYEDMTQGRTEFRVLHLVRSS